MLVLTIFAIVALLFLVGVRTTVGLLVLAIVFCLFGLFLFVSYWATILLLLSWV